jgi:hypothetical protein
MEPIKVEDDDKEEDKINKNENEEDNDMHKRKRKTARRKRKNGAKLSRPVRRHVLFRQQNSVPWSRRLTQKLLLCSGV